MTYSKENYLKYKETMKNSSYNWLAKQDDEYLQNRKVRVNIAVKKHYDVKKSTFWNVRYLRNLIFIKLILKFIFRNNDIKTIQYT